MLTPEGWFNGISATISLSIAYILGLSLYYHAKKSKAKLLSLMGLNIFLVGFFWLTRLLDFLTILFVEENFTTINNWIIMAILTWMWSPLVVLLSMYIGAELMIPNKKKYIAIIFSIMCIVWVLLISINPVGSFDFIPPVNPGEDLAIIRTAQNSLAIFLLYFFQISGVAFCGFGYLIKSFKSKEILKKKFMYLSIGYFIFSLFPFIGNLMPDPFTTYLISRLGMVTSFWFFYSGLKEEPIKRVKKEKYEKEIKVEESLFRLYERPEQITQEEITYLREQKICLVCKGEVLRLSYICPNCNALYCSNCSEELSNLENACWMCNTPFDESKPTRPFKREKEEKFAEEIEKSL
ncbi:MAG: hypothetical protein WBH31_17720 [Promethearchaeia archaeon]